MVIGIGVIYYDPRIQTFLGKEGASYLSKALKTRVRIRGIKIVDLHKIELDGLYVEDRNQDTLLNLKHLKFEALDFRNLDFKNRKVKIEELELDSLQFYLKRNSNQELNFDFILQYFDTGSDKGPSRPFLVELNTLNVKNLHFRYKSELSRENIAGKINFSDLDINHFNLEVHKFSNQGNKITGLISQMNFDEKSGFILQGFHSKVQVSNQNLILKKLEIITPHSRIGDRLNFYFKNWRDFDDFDNKIRFEGNIVSSKIESDDLAFFTSTLSKIHLDAQISGAINGRVNDFKLKGLNFKTGKETEIRGNFHIKNITEFSKTFIEAPYVEINSNRQDLSQIFKNIGEPLWMDQLPHEIQSLDRIQMEGNYQGGFNQFNSNVKIHSNWGEVFANFHFNHPQGGLPYYSGLVSGNGLPIGKILGEPSLGIVSFSSQVSGKGFGDHSHLDTLETSLNSLEYRGYTYHNIRIRGSQHQKSFTGKITINDPNLRLGFNGIINLNSKIPVFNFKTDIYKANLRNLGFIKDSLEVQTKLNISFSGNSLSNLNGKILATATTLKKNNREYTLDSILIGAEKTGLEKNLYIRSCILDADIKGRFDFKNLPIELKQTLGKYLPSLHWNSSRISSNQQFTAEIRIKDLNPVLAVVYPKLYVSPETRFYGNYTSKTQIFNLNGIFPEISYGNVEFYSVILDAENLEAGSIDINISTDSVLLGKNILTRSLNLGNSVNNDSLRFNLKVEDVNSINHLDLNGLIEVNNTQKGLSILPSVLVLENKVWKIENSFKIGFDPDKTVIKGFQISHIPENPIQKIESLSLNGIVSSNSQDSVFARFKHFELSTLDQILKQYGFTLSGKLNGNAQISAIFGEPSFSSTLHVDSLGLNGSLIGDVDLRNNWDGVHSSLDFNGNAKNKILSMIQLDGQIGLSQKNDGIIAHLNMDHANAALLEPFTKGILSQVQGTLSSKILISGKRDHPIINGKLAFNSTELTVNYLNTHYKLDDSIQFTQNNVNLRGLKIIDPNGRIAQAEGNLNLSHLDNPSLEGVSLHAENFLALNTDEKSGNEYFGKAFATGNFEFNGPLNQIHMDFDATTMPKTVLNIPLNRPNSVGAKDFIHFVSAKDSVNSVFKKRLSHTGVSLDFNLRITPDASVKLIFDDKIGDVIRGSGNSDLFLELTPQGDFSMYGDFEIEKGDYLFTSQNILNKLFTIEKGGNIRFSGDPLNADIDLAADYQARADVTPLYYAASVTSLYNNSASNVLVSSIIHLSGTLSNPSFDFNLKFPLAPYIEQELSTYLNSKQVVATQSMLFLISNQFNGALNTDNGKAIALSTGIQFVGRQLSNLLNNFSNRLDINVRSLQDYGISYRTLSNRLQISGNVTNTFNLNTNSLVNIVPLNSNQLIGDAEAILSLNPKGTLKVKGFWREVPVDFLQLSTTTLNPPINYTQGIGILFTKDFSSLKDLFKSPDKTKIKPNPSSSKKEPEHTNKNKTKIDFKDISH